VQERFDSRLNQRHRPVQGPRIDSGGQVDQFMRLRRQIWVITTIDTTCIHDAAHLSRFMRKPWVASDRPRNGMSSRGPVNAVTSSSGRVTLYYAVLVSETTGSCEKSASDRHILIIINRIMSPRIT
jgi:riboflavin biosynthesis pyrimidine reductase